MARLLTVVNERKRLRSQYRMHLEDEYIKQQKAKEQEEMLAQRERQTELGIKNTFKTKEETWQIIKKEDEKKSKAMADAREELINSIDSSTQPVTAAPMIKDDDIDLLAQTQVKLTQKDILKMYVGNWADLELKQRRKVMHHIQKQRAMHAK